MENIPDFLKYYDDESYLLGEVRHRFQSTGQISPPDFLMMLIWKANRAKTYHIKRLKVLSQCDSFKVAVAQIAGELRVAPTPAARMEVLMTRWGFYLATASAILTLLWPDDFTVYDYRVCGELAWGQHMAQSNFSEQLWDDYQLFKQKVEDRTPPRLSLRDKDRFLSGQSFYKDVMDACLKAG